MRLDCRVVRLISCTPSRLSNSTNRPPEVMQFAINPNENLVQMPPPERIRLALNSTFYNLRREHRTEPVPPGANRFVADVDAAFVEQIFDLSQRKRKPDIHHYGQTNDLGRCLKISEWIFHPSRLRTSPSCLKPFCPDSATSIAEHRYGPRTDRRSIIPITQLSILKPAC